MDGAYRGNLNSRNALRGVRRGSPPGADDGRRERVRPMKNWKSCCKEIYQDDDGWWAVLKPGYFWGADDNTVFNGETWKDLVKAAKETHR